MAPFGFTNGVHFFGKPTVIPEHVRDKCTGRKSKELDEDRLDATAPGTVPVPMSCKPSFLSNLRGFLTLSVLWDTENLLWVVMAILLYVVFPFPDFEKKDNQKGIYASPLSSEFFWLRFPVWFWTHILYVGTFHFGVVNWCKRPFATSGGKGERRKKQQGSSNGNSSSSSSSSAFFTRKMIHNAFYSIVGVAIWVCFENVVCHLWAHGRLPYTGTIMQPPSKQSYSQKPVLVVRNLLTAVFGFSFALFWKDFCFFFGHRAMHARFFYVFTHALHHRSASPDVFGGVAMHPAELLGYYATVLVSLLLPPLVLAPLLEFLLASTGQVDAASLRFLVETLAPPLHPSVLVWIGVHQQISPAGAHSSVEDHWQCDFWHYLHHRFYECAYSTTGTLFLDEWFGSAPNEVYFERTTRSSKGGDASELKTYHQFDEKNFAKILASEPEDAKATLVPDRRTLLLQNKDGLFSVFFILMALCWAPWVVLAIQHPVERVQMQAKWFDAVKSAMGRAGDKELNPALLDWSIAALAAFGPLLVAFVLHGKWSLGEALAPFWTKRPVWETVLVMLLGTVIFSGLPICVCLKLSID